MGTMEPPMVADYALSSNAMSIAFQVFLMAAAAMILYAIRAALLILRKFDSSRYPPVAEGGFRKHMSMAMSTEMPFWLLVRQSYVLCFVSRDLNYILTQQPSVAE